MNKKKGVRPLIATVMLVGFAVALAAVVSTFVIKETKKFNPESFLEDSPYCENIVIEAVGGLRDTDDEVIPITIKDANSAETDPQKKFYLLDGMGIKNKGSFIVKRYLLKSA